MKLFYRKYGQGQALIILHGLFGQSDNWNTLAKQFGDKGFEVYTVDQRNHGLSPHSDVWNYKAMSDDILELIKDNNLQNVILLGHSMGAKTAMEFVLHHCEYLDKLIVVDMAPKFYPLHHHAVLQALQAVDFNLIKTRKEVEGILSNYITDVGTKQFLLKNLYWKENGDLAWRFNLKVIAEQIENAGEEISSNNACNTASLFIRGEKSNYILDEDMDFIKKLFPNSTLKTVAGSGHWVHAEKQKEFFDAVMEFVKH
ncbi:MAG: alpha/beta fold hydrolase [Bacteroidetes bacterium]|nr:alpha/beta fold hydrolase [Bacteroidota bacterium]